MVGSIDTSLDNSEIMLCQDARKEGLEQAVAELQEALTLEQSRSTSSKEECKRKDILIRSLRANKVSMETELHRQSQLIKTQEVNISRLASSESTKAELIKALKRKHEEAVVAASDKEMLSPSLKEVLQKLHEYEGKMTRLQARLDATKAKLSSAAGDVETLKAEAERLAPFEAKYEDVRLSNQRKDLTLKSYKEIVEKTSYALDKMRNEYEKYREETTSDRK